ncbi:TPA: DUF4222 domain-containing protein [Escherichia coli]|nr:DUF4222 domain-containing protein [Escherichia coli]
MRQVNRWFKDHYGVPVRVIRWEPETQRVCLIPGKSWSSGASVCD